MSESEEKVQLFFFIFFVQKQPQEVFCKIDVFKNFAIFTGGEECGTEKLTEVDAPGGGSRSEKVDVNHLLEHFLRYCMPKNNFQILMINAFSTRLKPPGGGGKWGIGGLGSDLQNHSSYDHEIFTIFCSFWLKRYFT